MKKTFRTVNSCLGVALITLSLTGVGQGDLVADFDDFVLPANSHYNGPDPSGVNVPGPFGTTIREGSIHSRGVEFVNRYNLDFDSWTGFAVSNESDTTTPGFGNQFSAFPGTGAGVGADNYGVAFGFDDLTPNLADPTPFDSMNVDHLRALSSFVLPAGYQIASAMVTNTTTTALSMLNGDSFAKMFGGVSGNDPDFLKLSVYGIDANGQALGTEVEFYLADYRFADNSQDYIVSDWTSLDLSQLADARSLHFNLSSSDVGDFGMNTPAFFAIDDVTAVPEPGSFLLMAFAGLCGGGLARRRCRRVAEQ